ncbi:MAG TPA: 50S ribosomal protein L15 [Chloroflexota bacterium]|jgi:large subunit ribosomal protein L15|nr:50S ribosomal protein L15 [Chloroflexota bacterium]
MSISLNDLHPAPGSRPSRRRLGRGHGSGRGKTAGKGTKGQKARTGAHMPRFFEGGQNPLIHRMPTRRGLHFRKAPGQKPATVNLRQLNTFAPNQTVDLQTLIAARIVGKNVREVKVLADGELAHPLTVAANQFSAAAKSKIEAAGGQAVVVGATRTQES